MYVARNSGKDRESIYMIEAIAPTRLSLFGGGTDLPIYSDKYGGMVISMAINLRQHIELNGKTFKIPKKANMKFYKAFFNEFDYKFLYTYQLID